MSSREVRVSPDGKVAILFTQAIRYHSDLTDEDHARHWRALEWPDTGALAMHALTDEDVKDWLVVYYGED